MSASRSRRSFSQGFKDERCREVISTSKPVVDVAKSYGVGTETLRRWLIKYRQSHGDPDAAVTGAALEVLRPPQKPLQT